MKFDSVFIMFVAVMVIVFIAIYLINKYNKNKITIFYYSQYQADKEDGIVRMSNGMVMMREVSATTKHVYHEGKWHRYTFMANYNDNPIGEYPQLDLKIVCKYENYNIAINEKAQSEDIPFSYKVVNLQEAL